ncbi:MAG: hypothetical protein ACKVIH_03965 [Burkholderiales bacterium]
MPTKQIYAQPALHVYDANYSGRALNTYGFTTTLGKDTLIDSDSLGIQFDPTRQLALLEGVGNNPYTNPSFNPTSLNGKTASLAEGGSAALALAQPCSRAPRAN